MVHEHDFFGEEIYLIQPRHIGATWTRENLHQRSVVINAEGEIISASFKKFHNWDEKPELDPIPSSLKGAQLMEKLDGSTLIFSRYKGKTIIRTRGTIDASTQPLNGHEIEVLKQKYPKFMEMLEHSVTTHCSYVFEWTSPLNRIVIDYGAVPEMYLIAIIYHDAYSYANQAHLNQVAVGYDLKRPRLFSYDSIDEMKSAVEAFKGVEGLCVYYNDGQSIRKVKAAHYLLCHRMKSEVSSVEKVIDLWFAQGRPTYQEFYKFIADTFDHELAVMCQGNISQVCDAWKGVQPILNGFATFVDKVKHLSRREAAEKILQAYGQTNRASFVFALLDGKVLNNDQLKKLLYQVIKVK
jgi:hypothetical protein